MAKEKIEKKGASKEGDLVVKNKKFKKSDVLAFVVCIIVALVIWLYATNVELKNEKLNEGPQGETVTVQEN